MKKYKKFLEDEEIEGGIDGKAILSDGELYIINLNII